MKNNKTFSKLTIADKPVNVQVQWGDDEKNIFTIQLFEDTSSWTGTFTKESLEYYREEFDQTEEQYLTDVKNALEGNSEQFLYSLESENNVSVFKWKKVFEFNNKSAIRVHGKVKLQHSDTSTGLQQVGPQESLLDNLLKDNKELRKSNESYKEQNEKLNAELEKYKTLLEEFILKEKNLESMLYSKFVQVLNEKKCRIQLLEAQIKEFEN